MPPSSPTTSDPTETEVDTASGTGSRPEAVEAGQLRTPTFEALKQPEYRRFYIGQGISLIGTWLQAATVSWVVFEETGSTAKLGYIEMANLMPGMVIGLFAGLIADHIAPRRVILAALTVQMLLAVTLTSLFITGTAQFWHMLVILALVRVCVTFEMPSRQIFLFEIVGKRVMTNAIALNTGLFNASRTIGPALAGVLLYYTTATVCFVLNALSFVSAIAAVLTIRNGSEPRMPAERGPGAILGGFLHLTRDRRIAAAYGLMTFFGIAAMGYISQIPAYTRLIFDAGERGYGLLQASNGIGATLGALLIASTGGVKRRENTILAGMVVYGGFMIAAALVPAGLMQVAPREVALGAAALCLTGVGLGGIMFYSSTQVLIQTLVPDHLRGRIMGIWMIVFSASVPTGAFWVGHAVPLIGGEDLAAGLIIVMLLSAALSIGAAVFARAIGLFRDGDAQAELG